MAVRELLEELNATASALDRKELGRPFFADKRYEARNFSPNNFHDIAAGKMKLCFVDGGDQEIAGAPNFSVQYVRVYANCFEGLKRLEQKAKSEFLCVTTAEGLGDKIVFKAKILHLAGENLLAEEGELVFDSDDPTLKEAAGMAKVSVVGKLARRFAEWALTEKMIGSGCDAVVKDGTLQTSVLKEGFYANRCFEKAKEKKVLLCGLAKTSTLFTTTGWPLVSAVYSMKPEGKWYYWPICLNKHPDHRAEIFVVKLHERAERAFRFEVFREQAISSELFGSLAENSRDPVFLGYPYGLVDADAQARVSNRETAALKALAEAKIPLLKKFSAASNAHDVLDGM